LPRSRSAVLDPMSEPFAVLVEDDPEQAGITRALLADAGFLVETFGSIETALTFLDSNSELIDLFVLDRRLPVRSGESAADEFGDELLDQVREMHPDSRIIVFTGFATVRHVQQSLQGSGQLPARVTPPLDRITVLTKDQSLEFKEQVEAYRSLLQELDDIEIVFDSAATNLGAVDRRILRRVGFEHGAVSIAPTALSGGLTGASVWKCDVRRVEGSVGTIVIKQVKTMPSLGGLPELLPRANATSTMATLSGLMGGNLVNILQLAGSAPYPLMDLILDRPGDAAVVALPIFTGLRAVSEHQKMLTIAEICAPLGDWVELTQLLTEVGIAAPAGSLNASTKIGMRHGDLHPGNILIDEGQPVIIDFDSSCFASSLLDPITLLISTLVHPDSPMRGVGWPSPAEIANGFGSPGFALFHPQEAWFASIMQWAEESKTSYREYWALVLAYAARQLKYDDIRSDPKIVERVVALATRASAALMAS
jgi:CheY-like chemotaxis protein